jgi:hypothetical protein
VIFVGFRAALVKKLAKIFVDFFIKKYYNYYRNKKEKEKISQKISKKPIDKFSNICYTNNVKRMNRIEQLGAIDT